MTTKYPHLLAPMQVGNHVFKNHIISAPMGLHALQGGEPYPTEEVIACFGNKAKGGAGCVTMTGSQATPFAGGGDGYHHGWDIFTEHNRKMLERLSEAVHFYGAKASMEINGSFAAQREYAVSAGKRVFPNGMEMDFKEMDKAMIEESIESYATHAKKLAECGFDMVLVHMAYRSTIAAQFISPISNKRTDEYGGSAENRARYIVEVCEAIKKACGKNFLIELRLSAFDTDPAGIKIEDTITLAKMLEGKVDLIHAHSGTGPDVTNMGSSHIMGFRPDYALLPGAEMLKAGGSPIKIGAIGGFQDPAAAEQVLAEGKADYIVMARGLIADPNAVNKMYAGKPEDIVPCIKCMRCHDSACFENRFLCSVNPTIGLEHKLDRMISEPTEVKNVAVVGGGPAGMEAAIVAADRGHKVTLFEKNEYLGGQLVFADYAQFKRNLSKFKNYLAAQVAKKENIEVRLGTTATADMLGEYDVVLAALGAQPFVPPIPGTDSANVITAPEAFGNEDKLAQKVVIIGGGQVGCETANHLAECGKDVTLIEMQSKLAPDASQTYRNELIFYMDQKENLKYITGARCASVGEVVVYTDEEGATHELEAGTVIMAAGMRPLQADALALSEGNFNIRLIGDCGGLGNVTNAMRSAFSAASII